MFTNFEYFFVMVLTAQCHFENSDTDNASCPQIPLWSSREIVRVVQDMQNNAIQDNKIFGISIDTRTLQPGDLFIALKGPHFDGHNFLSQAFAQGAAAALTQQPFAIDAPIIQVENTFQALHQLAATARKRFQGTLLALTGSFGKTTTKEWLKHVLSDDAYATKASFNNHIGLPLTLSCLPETMPYGILEMGMDRAGEIKDFVALAQPHIALITTIAAQHLNNFQTITDIVRAKCEILSSPLTRTAIVPRDNPHYELIKTLGSAIPHWISFGKHPNSTARLMAYHFHKGHTHISASINSAFYHYTIPFSGEHWVFNSLAVLAACYALKINLSDVCTSFQNFTAVPGRGQVLNISGIHVIDESYNAGPDSIIAALKSFQHTSAPKYIVLGEMSTFGEQSKFYHELLYQPIMQSGAKGIWLCGPHLESLSKKLPNVLGYGITVNDIIPDVLAQLKPGDHLLVKGSRSMRTFLVIDALYRHYGLLKEAMNYPLRPYFSV